MMRARPLVALLMALALVLAACSDEGADANGAGDSADAEAAAEAEDDAPAEDVDPEGLDLGQAPELDDPVDLEGGVAATVDDDEIAADAVEERFESVAALPQVAEQLEGEDGERARTMLEAQILQNLVVQEIIAHGAEDLGVEPSAEDVQAAEDEAAEAFEGGPEAFEEALEEEGVTDEQREQEFRFTARVDAIRAEVADDVDPEELGEEGEELGLEPADIAFQEWFAQRLAETEVQVDQRFGVWSPASGEVIPQGVGE